MAPRPAPGPSEAPNLGKPSRPRPAASLLLLRDRGGIEVLMLKRSAESHFMPNVWVFPGGSVDPEDGPGADGLKTCARRELEEEAGIALRSDAELVPSSRWVTPEVIKVRFDTWFFLAAAPEDAVARPDGFEMTEAVWISPSAAVEEALAETMAIVFPTRKQLEGLTASVDVAAALTAAKADPAAERIVLPKVIGSTDEYRVVLPGDPDYP